MQEKLATAAELEVALSKVSRLAPVCFRRSESDFGDLESALNAGYNELKTGLEDRPSQEIVAAGNILLPMTRWLLLNVQALRL